MASGSSGKGTGGKAGRGKLSAAARRSPKRVTATGAGSKAGDFGAPF
jgi:hypothetical protein